MFLNNLLFVCTTTNLLDKQTNTEIELYINNFLTQAIEFFEKTCKRAEEIIDSYEQDLNSETNKKQSEKEKETKFLTEFRELIELTQLSLLAEKEKKLLEISNKFPNLKTTTKNEFLSKINAGIDALFDFGNRKLKGFNQTIRFLEPIITSDNQASKETKTNLKSFKESNDKSIKQLPNLQKGFKTKVEKVIEEIYEVNDSKKEENIKIQKNKEAEKTLKIGKLKKTQMSEEPEKIQTDKKVTEKSERIKKNKVIENTDDKKAPENTYDKKIPEKNGLSPTKLICLIVGIILGVVIVSVVLYFLLLKKKTTTGLTDVS